MKEELITIEGTVKDTIFADEESGYQVIRFETEGKDSSSVTVVGRISALTPGEMLRISGSWVRHPQFGRQFKAEEYSFLAPRSISGLIRYLGSGMIKGIGPVTAKRIVEHFGMAALEVLDNYPEKLREIHGIGKKKSAEIRNSWTRQKSIRDIMIFLQSYNISCTYAVKIHRQYGKNTIKKVKENPYALARDIHGVGFKIADRIAGNLGLSKYSGERIAAGLIFVLEDAVEAGNVYLPRYELAARAAEILEIPEAKVSPVFDRLLKEEVFIYSGENVYLPYVFQVERRLGSDLLRLGGARPKMSLSEAEERIEAVEKKCEIKFSPEQKQAVVRTFASGVIVLTGGPGTGKTTTVSGIINMCETINLEFALAAPTGRAARRMKESTGRPAKTIHRLLGYSPREGIFTRDENNPLHADVVIIDEVSMLDIFLAGSLLRALADGTTLVLVGDSDQLPSVGAGNVLWDIIDSGRFAVVRLNQIFRQAETSQIITNAHKINRGVIPRIINREADDFFFLKEEEPAKAAETIRDLVGRRLPKKYRLNPAADIQVLSPMYKGELGVNNLNTLIQKSLNPDGEVIAGGRFRLNDKVMQIKNNYEKNVFNGDIGIIEEFDREEKVAKVNFAGNRADYEYEEMDQLVPAYAISVHKSQGSEYPVVIMPVSTQHFIMLQRNLLYTGITRARRMVVLIGTKKALAIAVKNDKVVQRYTSLVAHLKGKMSG